MFCIISCANSPFEYLLWWSISSDPLLSFYFCGFVFCSFYYWVVRFLYCRYKSSMRYVFYKYFPSLHDLFLLFCPSYYMHVRPFSIFPLLLDPLFSFFHFFFLHVSFCIISVHLSSSLLILPLAVSFLLISPTKELISDVLFFSSGSSIWLFFVGSISLLQSTSVHACCSLFQ